MSRLVLVLVAALGLAACGGDQAAVEAGGSITITGPTTKTQRKALAPSGDARAAAPEIAGTTLTGETVSLADFGGRPLFVKVFAGY